MTILFMGPQGSGKGTQAKLLAETFGLKHVSIGDLLRAEVKSGSDIGKIVESYMNQGKLVPAHINDAIVKKVLDSANSEIILDGYPRNVAQAEFLLTNTNVSLIIEIFLDEQESINRLSKRLICTANNKIFVEGHVSDFDIAECKALGGSIVKRDDDRPEAIKKRLAIYDGETRPVIDFLSSKGVNVIKIDGSPSVEEVFSSLSSVFKSLS